MASAPGPSDHFLRVADQLHQLCEILEGLTWRVVELEERLASHERRESVDVDTPGHSLVGRWSEPSCGPDATEARLARIEALIHASGGGRDTDGLRREGQLPDGVLASLAGGAADG